MAFWCNHHSLEAAVNLFSSLLTATFLKTLAACCFLYMQSCGNKGWVTLQTLSSRLIAQLVPWMIVLSESIMDVCSYDFKHPVHSCSEPQCSFQRMVRWCTLNMILVQKWIRFVTIPLSNCSVVLSMIEARTFWLQDITTNNFKYHFQMKIKKSTNACLVFHSKTY